jgi:hypothetical protein
MVYFFIAASVVGKVPSLAPQADFRKKPPIHALNTHQ